MFMLLIYNTNIFQLESKLDIIIAIVLFYIQKKREEWNKNELAKPVSNKFF